jgi:hypothetical protein
MVAFIEGLNTATGRALLDGFDAWLLHRHMPGKRSSLVWDGLLAYIYGRMTNDGSTTEQRSYRDLSSSESEGLVKFMFDSLDEFLGLESQPS